MTVTVKKRKFNNDSDSKDIRTTIDDFGQKYHCDHCTKDITHSVIIRCAVCQDFDLCVDCFRKGVEIKEHKYDHAYRVIDALDFPIFERDWGVDEELLLVEGLELYGIGNWEQIADHIGTKNKLEVGDHYQRVYCNSSLWPMPNMTGRIDQENGKRVKARPPGYTVKKLQKLPRAPASGPANHDIAGFMPGRKEFDQEFDNDAEQHVKDMEFLEDDTPAEIELKCAMLNVYNTTLQRRAERKKFVFERGLQDFRKILGNEKKRSKEEKDACNKYRVFARMLTAQDFDIFMDGIVQELKIRARIAQLQEYRRMGITGLKEASDYEKEKATRIHNKSIGGYEKLVPRRDHTATPPPQRQGSVPLGRADSVSRDRTHLVTGSQDFDLLSQPEQSICLSLSLTAKAYLAIKDAVLKEAAFSGGLKQKQAKTLIKLESHRAGKLADFFCEMGWIQK
ncbi:hypothetical protein EDD86DRAFT_205837 [Gorgonomyces haynaldii]|nr:hypothetical protein EDD86DRAFT_205837 [Gorgonomyces haynaldii]